MKHAVIVAHPNAHSLTGSTARAYGHAATGLGHGVMLRDLYAMRFDPCLRAAEIPTLKPPEPADDVVAERRLLADADVLAFIYPFWFNAPPAILKGYVDRVFGMGFGFEATPGGGSEPLLDARRLITFSFSGAPEHWVQDTGALKALLNIFDGHLARMCGLEIAEHVHFGGILPNMTQEAVDDVLRQVEETVALLFGAGVVRTAADLVVRR